MDGEAWWAAVYGVAQSQTRLKRLSSSSVFFTLVIVFFFSGYFFIFSGSLLKFSLCSSVLFHGSVSILITNALNSMVNYFSLFY